jgi:protoheme IX farnesyltransferase
VGTLLSIREASLDITALWPGSADLVELARPRLVCLGVAVVALSYLIAPGTPVAADLALVALGSAMALCGASALNQVLERDTDALMRRTAARPVPAGRVSPAVALGYGLGITALGVAVLASGFGLLTAAVTAAGWILYVAAYTPLKRRTGAAVYVGTAPGAVPVLIGWAAASGSVDAAAVCLFLILCVWQMPHFLAIGWMYRADYRRAGLRVVPEGAGAARTVSRQATFFAALLVPLSLVPFAMGVTSAWWYVAGAVGVAAYQLLTAVRFQRDPTGAAARSLLRASVLVLPAMLTLLAAGSGGGS